MNYLLIVVLIFQAFTLYLLLQRGHDGISKRQRRLMQFARWAAAYAEQQGGTGAEKLKHALGHFDLTDRSDNRRRDYSDAEARLAIETVLNELERAK